MNTPVDTGLITTAEELETLLLSLANKDKAAHLSRYFKTGKGGYGEGDKFLGLTVPQQRALTRRTWQMPLNEIGKLLESEYHECRMTALLTLVKIYGKEKSLSRRDEIYRFYMAHHERINNWDLVDLSAPQIVGQHILRTCDYPALHACTRSGSLWLQRIAIISTYTLIKAGIYTPTLELSDMLLHHPHDLIHKAVGWMLREVGKMDLAAEEAYLLAGGRYRTMPRTMLRYAIEKFPEEKRLMYLKGKI